MTTALRITPTTMMKEQAVNAAATRGHSASAADVGKVGNVGTDAGERESTEKFIIFISELLLVFSFMNLVPKLHDYRRRL